MTDDKKNSALVCEICGEKIDGEDRLERQANYIFHLGDHRYGEQADWFGL